MKFHVFNVVLLSIFSSKTIKMFLSLFSGENPFLNEIFFPFFLLKLIIALSFPKKKINQSEFDNETVEFKFKK